MPLSWNEIRQRSILFAKAWAVAARERAEAQTFWNEFFGIFGVPRRTVASFEEPVRNLAGDTEFIDLLWPGRLIAEHKSRGQNLAKADTQAIGYIHNLVNEGRSDDVPRYILVSDFARIALHDLEPPDGERATIQFNLTDLPANIRHFAFMAGYQTRRLDPEDPANIKAAERLANLHDRLDEAGYAGHDLQRFMVRVLFCLFADDAGIFEPDTFKLYIQDRTRTDGSDLGAQLLRLFDLLNKQDRQANLDEDLRRLPYVNGQLFAEPLAFPEFNAAMRTALLTCCSFRWDRISPAIFGSLFQSIMEPRQRRQIGAHYTSERDILKLIRSLFLDDLRAEFETIRGQKKKLADFHRKLGSLKFLDPACGCGNFLVIGYRELRRLEMDVLDARFGAALTEGDIRAECRVNVAQFHGIEVEEWPVRIAEVALWLMDHQMNQELFQRFSQVKATVPLTSSPHIRQANALRLDWNDVLPADQCSYVMGNPPFVGKQFMTAGQKADMGHVFADAKGAGVLDFVAAWYVRASQFIKRNPAIRAALVATNSITQGEQAGALWSELFGRYNVKIHFAHRTFAWESEARAKAHVHVVIIGFGSPHPGLKRLFDYEALPRQGAESGHPGSPGSPATVTVVDNISPYLVAGPDVALTPRSKPICSVPPIVFGSMPNDGGHLLLDARERRTLLDREPAAAKYLRRFVGAEEFINGLERWCLWLQGENPAEFRRMPAVMDRVGAVAAYRRESRRETTRRLAASPASFGEIRQPHSPYLLIPSVSSERRTYIPIGFMRPEVIASNLVLIIPGAKMYHFGVLSSAMHMAWVRQVCGRMKSDYRYSNKIVYNNYPWHAEPSETKRRRVEETAQRVVDLRNELGDGRVGFLQTTKPGRFRACLADLYDPLTMPAQLLKAHADLDRAVDACYRAKPFSSERQRVEFLFGLYEETTAPLTVAPRRPRRREDGC